MTDSQQTPQGIAELQQDFIHEEQRGYTPAEDTEGGYRKPTLTFKEAVKICGKQKYCDYKGRARRSELWWFLLLPFVIVATIYFICTEFFYFSPFDYETYYYTHGIVEIGQSFNQLSYFLTFYIPYGIIAVTILASLLPALGAIFRRLHDVGKSGWYVGPLLIVCGLLYLTRNFLYYHYFKTIDNICLVLTYVCFVYAGYIIFLLCKDGEKSENKYGISPKYQNDYDPEYARISRPLEFIEAIRSCFTNNYFRFKGRSRRSEYCWFSLFLFIVYVCVFSLVWKLPLDEISDGYTKAQILIYVIAFILLFPALGVTVRRLHDVGKSGWYYAGFLFLGAVNSYIIETSYGDDVLPIVSRLAFLAAAIYILTLTVRDSQPTTNKWGPSPKYKE